MICTKCFKEMSVCRCPDAVERIRWLLGSDSPVLLETDYAKRLKRRMRELQGERELRAIRA